MNKLLQCVSTSMAKMREKIKKKTKDLEKMLEYTDNFKCCSCILYILL